MAKMFNVVLEEETILFYRVDNVNKAEKVMEMSHWYIKWCLL